MILGKGVAEYWEPHPERVGGKTLSAHPGFVVMTLHGRENIVRISEHEEYQFQASKSAV